MAFYSLRTVLWVTYKEGPYKILKCTSKCMSIINCVESSPCYERVISLAHGICMDYGVSLSQKKKTQRIGAKFFNIHKKLSYN